MKNASKPVTAVSILAMSLVSYVALAQDDLSEVTQTAGNWLERNWMWVAAGVLLLLVIIIASARKKRITTTTTTFRKDDGTVTKTTTVKTD